MEEYREIERHVADLNTYELIVVETNRKVCQQVKQLLRYVLVKKWLLTISTGFFVCYLSKRHHREEAKKANNKNKPNYPS